VASKKSPRAKQSSTASIEDASGAPHFIDASSLAAIVEVMARHDVTELSQTLAEGRLVIRRGPRTVTVAAPSVASAPSFAPHAPPPPAAPAPSPSGPAFSIAPPPAPANPRAAEDEAGVTFVTSPLVGTFYRAPSPDAPVFVEVGAKLRPGMRLCIVEAMKLMNEIESELEGTLLEILVENGKPVEYGQKLFKVKKG
jgi:acetyl-CoA carboxylase biotin carboxyl carrier protein